jgi:hypothetical protein
MVVNQPGLRAGLLKAKERGRKTEQAKSTHE